MGRTSTSTAALEGLVGLPELLGEHVGAHWMRQWPTRTS